MFLARSFKIIAIIVFLISLVSCKVKPDNENAAEYTNGKCVAFYPPESQKALDHVKDLCKSGEELIYDYRQSEAGDFYYISYYDGHRFYIDENTRDLKLEVNGGAEMLSDLLRYRMKKEGLDRAYTSKFWLASDKDELDLKDIDLRIEEDELKLYFKQFAYTLELPIGYAKMLTGYSLGGVDRYNYEKQVYIDPDRPMIALTYDDGPYRPVDTILYETLEKYGAKATFYSVGSRMTADELDNIATGIEKGMEFGSHTEYHVSLSKQEVDEACFAIMETVDYVDEKLGYRMKTYRPPYGNRNHELEDVIGMPAILWTVDSRDWSNRDEDITYQNVMEQVKDGDIILMHSLYKSTAKASQRLVPDLIDRGFQLVSVSELLTYKGYDMTTLKAYGSN
ncbi:MAG: polysaccharide deacetylase family protein [Erysipelotrichaceae bacterium]|nr:polysaccharide deacetylase family protein [Erysipelotrichaceae bacterium]